MARVISICNWKGGVGKTTSAVSLGAYLALMGRKTLVVDFDPQANASSGLGVRVAELVKSIYHGIIGDAHHEEIVHHTALSNLHVIPSAPHLAGALIELVDMPEREYFLRKFLNAIRHSYDYILIDMPPSLSLLTVNGLVASDEIIVPVQAEYYSLEGLGQLVETVDLIRNNMKHHLKIGGALLTMYNSRERLSRDVARDLRANFPHHVFATVIPRSVALAEAPSFGRPIPLYRPDSPGADAYRRLADEVIAQETPSAIPVGVAMSEGFGDFNIH
jgi:chromosome partitioning protein